MLICFHDIKCFHVHVLKPKMNPSSLALAGMVVWYSISLRRRVLKCQHWCPRWNGVAVAFPRAFLPAGSDHTHTFPCSISSFFSTGTKPFYFSNLVNRPSHLRSSIAHELLQLSLTTFQELNLLSSLALLEKPMFYTGV